MNDEIRTAFRAVHKRRASQAVVAQIQDLLISGRIRPGDRLPAERQLAETFQVGRSTVREAYRALEALGLIRVQPGAATSVAQPSLAPRLMPGNGTGPRRTWDQQRQLFEVRLVLDPPSAALAAWRLTVRIHTKRPEPLIEVLLSDRCAGIVSKAYHDKVGFEKADLAPIGAGPYRVVSFKARHQLVLERFDDYWGEKAPLDKITFTNIPDISSRITALINGEVDFIGNIPPDQEGPLQNRKDVKLLGVVWPMFHVYAFSMTHPVTGNKKLRQAMNLSVDRELLVKGLWQGKELVPRAHQFKEYGPPLYMPELVTVKYDPDKARQLVKESGYNGAPVLLTFLPHYYTYPSPKRSLTRSFSSSWWITPALSRKNTLSNNTPSRRWTKFSPC